MYIDYDYLITRIPDNAIVLDLGGWDKVFPRANFVADLLPYETRRNLHPDIPERFTKDSWIIADFCSPEFWKNINDKEFDFITIGHTLEDIRDPLLVCREMIRCSKAGYIEAPSKFRECSKTSKNSFFSGYDHHRWIIEPNEDLSGLIFKAKLAFAHSADFLTDRRRYMLNDYFHQFDGYFWQESFSYCEHFSKGTKKMDDLEWYFKYAIKENRLRSNIINLKPSSKSLNDGKCLWTNSYKLASEAITNTEHLPANLDRYSSEKIEIP
jgi:hypothetical protein